MENKCIKSKKGNIGKRVKWKQGNNRVGEKIGRGKRKTRKDTKSQKGWGRSV